MASLLPADRAQFSAIIDDILASSDLNTISAKTIRKGLQDRLKVDISRNKQAVQELIMQRFDAASARAAVPALAETNGHHTETKVEESAKEESTPPVSSRSSAEVDAEPPKKKRKSKEQIDDEQFAKMLQDQENRGSRATRGAAKGKVVKRTPKKKTKKLKSEKKIKPEDDSELDEVGSDGEVKEKKEKKGGFHKLYHLSAPLADLVGEPTLSRPQVVKKIWEYIKARDLQDPSDKRQIRCDERMQLVFKQDKVHMFTMNKILGKQLYDVEEE